MGEVPFTISSANIVGLGNAEISESNGKHNISVVVNNLDYVYEGITFAISNLETGGHYFLDFDFVYNGEYYYEVNWWHTSITSAIPSNYSNAMANRVPGEALVTLPVHSGHIIIPFILNSGETYWNLFVSSFSKPYGNNLGMIYLNNVRVVRVNN